MAAGSLSINTRPIQLDGKLLAVCRQFNSSVEISAVNGDAAKTQALHHFIMRVTVLIIEPYRDYSNTR
jgi:hypothetical protein